jgi:plasmid maintenance system antidote protein VapI
VDTGNQGLYIHGTEFGNSAEFWMGLQDDFDLEKERLKIESDLSEIRRMKVS